MIRITTIPQERTLKMTQQQWDVASMLYEKFMMYMPEDHGESAQWECLREYVEENDLFKGDEQDHEFFDRISIVGDIYQSMGSDLNVEPIDSTEP